ncbi:MAG: hypothetical protein LBV29_02200 [Azoarcus sp.]|nr:hypothetical protein [Azoarcus sp.]
MQAANASTTAVQNIIFFMLYRLRNGSNNFIVIISQSGHDVGVSSDVQPRYVILSCPDIQVIRRWSKHAPT